MASDATVPHIVKLERLEDEPANEELLKIAPFMAAEQENSTMVKYVVTHPQDSHNHVYRFPRLTFFTIAES